MGVYLFRRNYYLNWCYGLRSGWDGSPDITEKLVETGTHEELIAYSGPAVCYIES
ncbi:MAG: hypothetical protein GX089_08585 [Fibrobacter sp.]|nr:hypothetical protein [Fibrobacter sp.]